MIKIDGVELRTEAQWGQKYRAVLKRQIGKGVKRQWITPGGRSASAVFFREDQTRPYNQKEMRRAQRKQRELARTRKERLSCKCCGEYFGRDARYELADGLCEFCCKPHTAWQWLALKHCAPKRGEKPTGRHPRYWNPKTDGWVDSPKEWFYYASTQVSRVNEKRFERLKSLYIKRYGGMGHNRLRPYNVRWAHMVVMGKGERKARRGLKYRNANIFLTRIWLRFIRRATPAIGLSRRTEHH